MVCVHVQLKPWIFMMTLQLVKDHFFLGSTYKHCAHSYVAFISGVIQAKI